MKKFVLTMLSLCCISVFSATPYKYMDMQMEEMNEMKQRIASKDEDALRFLDDLVSQADKILDQEPLSVMTKEVVPPSGDKHDYISTAPYWWPDPSKPDGLPYIRRDGEINPERAKYTDNTNIKETMRRINTLGKAYFYTGNVKYVKKATKLLSVFFLDPKTKMNPNLRYGQFVPGLNDGRCYGIIETAGLVDLISGVTLLSNSSKWNKKKHAALQEWMYQYYTWLMNSELGTLERNTKNNHGTYYDKTCIALLLFCDKVDEARNHISIYTIPRMRDQVRKDGSQPEELARTKAWGYATGNLRGFVDIALIGEKIGVDLWNYENEGQVYIKSMIDWFIPYLKKEKQWAWQQIQKDKVTAMSKMLELAASRYHNNLYHQINEQLTTIHPNITK